MQGQTYTTTATLSDKRTLLLDSPVPIPAGRVRITVEALPPAPSGLEFLARLQTIHASLQASGHQPPTKQEVDSRLQIERDTWEES
jgi:hypothetical protein